MRLLHPIAHDEGRAEVIVGYDARIREFADRVLWLEDGRFLDLDRLARDPLCAMAADRGRAVAAGVDGQVHSFCSEGCRQAYGRGNVAAATRPI